MLEEEKQNNNQSKLGIIGNIVKVGLSILLAGYLAKKLVNKYPGDEIPNFAKGVGIVILITFVIVMVLGLGFAIISGMYCQA